MAKREREEELGGRWVAPSVSGGKFWTISVDGTSVTTTWGKLESAGQSSTKAFKSEEEARSFATSTIAKKEKDGYEKQEEEKVEEEQPEGEEGEEGGGDLASTIADMLEFDDSQGRTANRDSVRNLEPVEDGRLMSFTFEWSDGAVQQAWAQRYQGHWLIGPPSEVPTAALQAAVAAMHAELENEFGEEGPEKDTVYPELRLFPTMKDETALVDDFPIVIRFSNTWSDHGFWAGVTADGSKAQAATFN